ncbi:UDP binding domain-containing protein [Streptomyces sp. NPDC056161]|uniref:UDP binding domain-containing protein n=1 Tax=Streptomyces sp. NPDC056161 TaxID=3345732 RepID=UPI0035D6C91E
MPDVLVVGDWHLASVTVAGLTEAGYTVTLRAGCPWEADPAAAQALLAGRRAAGEPRVAEVMAGAAAAAGIRTAEGADETQAAAVTTDLIVIAFDSRTTADGSMADDRPARSAEHLLCTVGRTAPVLLTSQVRAGTCDRTLATTGAAPESLVHAPENLRLGRSMADFLRPHRLVLGCAALELPPAVKELTARLEPGRVLHTGLVEAELIKHGTNAYLAACITLANDIGAVTAWLGGDPQTVLEGVRADERVAASAPLRPGGPYSGATLQRDVRALWEQGEPVGRDGLFRAISAANSVHSLAPLAVLDRRLEGLRGRRICLLGLTYKPDVTTLRDSPARTLAHELSAQGAHVTAYDPVADQEEIAGLHRHARLAEAADGADCLVVVAEHRAFTHPGFLDAVRPRRPLLLRLAGTRTDSSVATPPGWQSIDPWQR